MANHHGLWIGLLLITAAATAQEDEYALLFQPPKVVTALRYLTPAAHAPASADVITAEDLRRFGYRTVAEAVSSLPGFQATYDRAYAHLQVRGFYAPGDYNSRILVLIDGHRLNENLQDYAGLDSDFPLAMQDIERIEVVRGPGSSLYGSSALLAVIQIISKQAAQAPSLELQGQGGSFGSHQERLAGAVKSSPGSRRIFPEPCGAGTDGGCCAFPASPRYANSTARTAGVFSAVSTAPTGA